MTDRAERVRKAAARWMVVGITGLVGAFVVLALARILVKSLTHPGYFPRAWSNTLLTFGMVIAGLLTLRFFDTSWRRAFFLFISYCIAAMAAMTALEYRLYVVQLGRPFGNQNALYAPHLAILLVALILGFKPSWLMSGVAVIYVVWLSILQDIPLIDAGLPIFVALALPFTALLMERLLDEAEREARRAYQAETSLSVMAHDLGNPLTVLSSSLEMLEELDVPPEQRETLMRAIRRNTRSLRNLLDEFREIPHLDESVPMEMLNLRDIVHDVIDLYARPMCEEQDKRVSTNLEAVEVVGAASRLGRLTRELLTNAIKYTPPGGHIEVSLQQAGKWAILQVSDDGWGIEEKELAYVFDQNWRGSTASQKQVSGTGLGLYICRNIVMNHGGRIEVESHKGQGTTFTVHFPLPETAPTPPSMSVSPAQPKTESPRSHILSPGGS